MAGDDLLRMHFDPHGALLEATLECEADVFHRWYGNTREDLAREYGPYEPATTFVALSSPAGRVVGSCRIITPALGHLKTLDDLAGPPWSLDGARALGAIGFDLDQVWDVATFCVYPRLGRRGAMAALALYHGLIAGMRANGARAIVAMLDERVRSLMLQAGMPSWLLPGASTQPYLGSAATSPVWADLIGTLDHQRRFEPETFQLISEGRGLDGIVLPPVEEFRLHRVPTLIDLAEPQPSAPQPSAPQPSAPQPSAPRPSAPAPASGAHDSR